MIQLPTKVLIDSYLHTLELIENDIGLSVITATKDFTSKFKLNELTIDELHEFRDKLIRQKIKLEDRITKVLHDLTTTICHETVERKEPTRIRTIITTNAPVNIKTSLAQQVSKLGLTPEMIQKMLSELRAKK